MVFNDDLLFIHIGKTGGLSCSKYLLFNLKAQVYNCHKTAARDVPGKRAHEITALDGIGRHSTLDEALAFISSYNGKKLSDFKKVIAVIRHPFTLEYSLYKHLQKPEVMKQRGNKIGYRDLVSGDFANFVHKSNYHRPNHPQESFFLLAGERCDSVELVKFEELAHSFPAAAAPYMRKGELDSFPYINRTAYQSDRGPELTDELKERIYQKHRYMFDSGLYHLE